MTTEEREAMAQAIRQNSERLAADLERTAPRVRVRCERGCLLFEVYEHARLGRVIVKRPQRRGEQHAEREATTQRSTTLAAPVEALIAAAGGAYVGGLLTCEEHLEASVSPDGLRWYAQRTGTHRVRFADLKARKALPHNETDVRVLAD